MKSRLESGHNRVARPEKAQLVRRANRIVGQTQGVTRMIDEDRYCVDILTQIAAARSALDALSLRIMREHAHGCLQEAIRSGDGRHAIDELMTVVGRLTR